jgi:trk system potassium uptake protein TrkH
MDRPCSDSYHQPVTYGLCSHNWGYAQGKAKENPRAVRPIRFNYKAVPDDILQSILSFVVLYIGVFVAGAMLLTLLGVDIISSVTASITTLGNINPGFNIVGPMANFESIPPLGKIILINNMWVGRLEVYTVLVLFTSEFWHS